MKTALLTDTFARRWTGASAGLGGIAWLLLILLPSIRDALGMIALWLIFAVLVIVPLALALLRADLKPQALAPFHAALLTQPFSAALVVLAFFQPSGTTAALLTLPWGIVTALLALSALMRLARGGLPALPEGCGLAALLYIPVGWLWLLFSRFGANPVAFGEPIVLLTAIHFHYAGFALPILTHRVGEYLERSRQTGPGAPYRFVALGVISGTPLIALGITFSPCIEVAAVLFLVASIWTLTVLVLFRVTPSLTSPLASVLLALSAISLAAGMLLASLYAISEFREWLLITIPEMVMTHGWINAVGGACCGLLGWRLVDAAEP